MRVSMKWLRELIDGSKIDEMGMDAFLSLLDMTGTGVEGTEVQGSELPGVVIGHILAKEPHPDADKLHVTRVDIGEEEPLQIVCGATNFEAGDKVPVATVGAVLPGDFVIKKSKLRGVVSMGMNCSAKELGVGSGHAGLLILPPDAPVGASFSEWYGASDTILDLEITPNRPDCLSMKGLAREVGAILEVEPKPIDLPQPAESDERIEDIATVTVEDAAACPRYSARVIRGVKIGPSPEWLANRVEAMGARSINNVVDITNYILFELGQPLHAFDLGQLAKGTNGKAHVTVRRAAAGEKLTTLDGVARTLDAQNIVIADEMGASCLAGVMGGENSEVSDQTVDIFLESAVFDPAITSRTSRSLALISESSLRFERGVDAQQTIDALNKAAAMMAEIAGGTVVGGIIDEYPQPVEPLNLELRAERLNGLIGQEIPLSEAAAILRRLGFGVTERPEALEVTVPTFRPDVTREVDLIEEVLRIYGMERITPTLPGGRKRVGGLTREQRLVRKLGATLRAAGLNETMTYPFADLTDLEKIHFQLGEDELYVELHNPMSSEQSLLRPSLLPGLLHVVSSNLSKGVKNIALYEMGKTFITAQGRKTPKENERVLGILSGSWNEAGWNDPATPLDFFDAKGVVETAAQALSVDKLRFEECTLPWLQPGRSASILLGKQVIGWVGEIHPSVANEFDIDASVVAFEFSVSKFLKASKPLRDFVVPPKFPALELDIALVVDEAVSAESIEKRILSLGRKSPLASVRLFDVYRGKGVEQGKKSLAYKLVYQSDDHTLSAEEVEKPHEKLLERLASETGATLRQ